ncbi:hypothetical protein IGI04_023058 [Brassica rapa subsp. trilocularis]|uniref:Uncharacterized protein n=1 Tax=Brassica rapa subsp. trilocularis TaxID=1813537 RepID=A0ABQ7M434_BRACM|nr:hypothetical protein IGI04_023058 [Brassica rapa subsp. trilocularis]
MLLITICKASSTPYCRDDRQRRKLAIYKKKEKKERDLSRRFLSTSTDETSYISIDGTSDPTIDCPFIVSIDFSSHRPMRPFANNTKETKVDQPLDYVTFSENVYMGLDSLNKSGSEHDLVAKAIMALFMEACPILSLFRVFTDSWTIWRKVVILVSFGTFLSAELHICVRCLAINGDLSTVRLSPYFNTSYRFELDF